jgi:hypothetical protein
VHLHLAVVWELLTPQLTLNAFHKYISALVHLCQLKNAHMHEQHIQKLALKINVNSYGLNTNLFRSEQNYYHYIWRPQYEYILRYNSTESWAGVSEYVVYFCFLRSIMSYFIDNERVTLTPQAGSTRTYLWDTLSAVARILFWKETITHGVQYTVLWTEDLNI